MNAEFYEQLTQKLGALSPVKSIGRVAGTDGGHIQVTGLTKDAKLADQVEVEIGPDRTLRGEVVQIQKDHIVVMPDGSLSGLSLGSKVICQNEQSVAPTDAWLGRVIDANGNPLDQRPLRPGFVDRPLQAEPIAPTERQGLGARFSTGSDALNTVLPLVAGQRLGIFAGSGVGKTTLLGTLVKNLTCDVTVVALIGERGREVRHFTQDVLGTEGMASCVVVAATSDRPALERRRCAWTAMSIAEHFRDQGKSVLYVADSVTRFAEAHREVASATGEIPVLRGHPPSSAHMITKLCERAGPGRAGSGSITAVFTVLVQGSDMEEPVADMLRGVLDGHVVLSRTIAERGRYPAIDLLKSVSRSLPEAASDTENDVISKVRNLISYYEQNAMMVRSGLYTQGSDPELDQAIKLWPLLDGFLGTVGPSTVSQSFDRLRLILRRNGVN